MKIGTASRKTNVLVLTAALFVLPVAAQRLHFGTNLVQPGRVIVFDAPLNALGHLEAGRLRLLAPKVRGALVLPAGLTNLLKPCPLLIVSVPSGGSAIGGMFSVTNRALKEGWAVLAADGPKVGVNDDTVQFGWGILSSVLEQFTRTWPQARQWPVASTGFSGGAKRAAFVGAGLTHGGWNVVGVFMGGCNEDRATLGLEMFQPGARFRQVPFFLSNGANDPIAGPQKGAAVADSMRASGFVNLRLETYAGDHRPDDNQFALALQWFKERGRLRVAK